MNSPVEPAARSQHCYSQLDVNEFGRLMGAKSRVHFDPDWAKERLGGTIVPGVMLLAPVYGLARRLGAEPGFPNTSVVIKFIRPVRVGRPFSIEACAGEAGFDIEIASDGVLCVIGTLTLPEAPCNYPTLPGGFAAS